MDYLTNRLKGNKRAWLKRQQWRNRSSSNRKGVSEEEIEGYVPKLKTMTEEKNTNRFFFPARKVKVFYRTKMDETWEEREKWEQCRLRFLTPKLQVLTATKCKKTNYGFVKPRLKVYYGYLLGSWEVVANANDCAFVWLFVPVLWYLSTSLLTVNKIKKIIKKKLIITIIFWNKNIIFKIWNEHVLSKWTNKADEGNSGLFLFPTSVWVQ